MKRAASAVLAGVLAGCGSASTGLVPPQSTATVLHAPSTGMSGNVRSGFEYPRCAASVPIDTLDGSPIASLTSDDAQLRVERSTSNRFVLRAQGIPDGNSVAHLTATLASRAGAFARNVRVEVHVDGTICGVFKEFVIPTKKSSPHAIASGPDGALWFTEFEGNKIGRITTAGKISETPVKTPAATPFVIAAGPDGALWFTENAASKIGRITTAKAVTEYKIKTTASAPNGIAAGTDKTSMWFVEGAGNNVGQISTSTKAITEYPIPTANAGAYTIAPGPGGLMYFTEYYANQIASVDKTGLFKTGTPKVADASPLGIVSDGSTVWFTENCIAAIGRNHPFASYPTKTAASFPNFITLGPDGALWFTEGNAGKIGRITTAGAVTEFTIPTAASGPFGIATGPDGSIWFTESYTNKIGRLQ
jgi:virginiamycin B lyase